MNHRRTKCLALLGHLPLDKRFLCRPIRLKTAKRLERDGWIKNGEGFADAQMLVGVYCSYYRDEIVVVTKEAAIPHYPVFSGSPDYWMYGEMTKRHYLHHYMDGDRLEVRGVSFHSTPRTLTFRHEKLNWADAVGWWAE